MLNPQDAIKDLFFSATREALISFSAISGYSIIRGWRIDFEHDSRLLDDTINIAAQAMNLSR